MGSKSDWPAMEKAAEVLQEFEVHHECRVVSAHRTPKWMVEYAQDAAQRRLRVIIAGAGGAAHLPGMVASMTPLPVLGVPIQSRALSGIDSLLSIAQMPGGVPVGTLAIGEAGATVVIAGRNEDKNRKSIEELNSLNIECRSLIVDVTNENSCNKLIEDVVQTFGKLNILIKQKYTQ